MLNSVVMFLFVLFMDYLRVENVVEIKNLTEKMRSLLFFP